MLRLLSALTLAVFISSPEASDWVTFSPSDSGFTVSMPASPAVSSRLIQSPSGLLTTRIASAEVSRNTHLTVSWTSYPIGVRKPKVSDLTIDKMVDALVDSRDGSNVVQHDISNGSYKARDVTFTTENGATVRTRFFVADRRVYQLSAEWAEDFDGAAETNRFFESFKLNA